MVKRATFILVAFLSVSAIIGFVVTRPGGIAKNASGAGDASAGRALSIASDVAVTGISGEAVSAPAALPVDQSATTELPGLPPLGQAVVKTSDITVEVRKGTFGAAFNDASLVAAKYGGYVQASSMAGDEAKSGDLVLRVPSAHFDDAMADLRGLGTVKHEAVSGQVVTQDFVDLEARLRTWESQEAVLLGLMAESTSIDQTLRVQRELQDVQFRIEQIKGQLRVLADQTSLATIRVSMYEAGVPVVVAQDATPRPSLLEAWNKAVAGILGVAYVTIVGLGYLVPITLLALLVWLGYRRFGRRPPVEAPQPTA
jgi:hypothetical protein